MNINDYYTSCRLCPRSCDINRFQKTGACGADAQVRVARAALHMWEEPCISGVRGSGAVFFAGCSLGCVFCQNHDIARGGGLVGKIVSTERLAEIFLELQGKGANNINLVTPDHYAPSIVQALDLARVKGLRLPVICNCSGYMSPEVLKLFEGYIDVWLPDFKYVSAELSGRYSKAPDYFEIASAALAEMVRQCPAPVFDDEGMIQSGVIVRHLTLPGHGADSKKVIQYLHETYGDSIYISIMNQYTPMPHIGERFPELDRKVPDRVYEALIDYALRIGVENGFIQEGETAKESFIPTFDNEGV